MKPKQPQTNPEFERFKEFTQKLMQVPKKEIDRQKAVYEKKKLSPLPSPSGTY